MSSASDCIRYATTEVLSVEQFVDILTRSGLGERRPVGDAQAIEGMLRGANVLATAWSGDVLVGLSRAISDFTYCTYLSDLAVDKAFQCRGIGRELIRRTHEAAGVSSRLLLLAAPAADGYYQHIGMTKHESCWTLPGNQADPVDG